MSGAENISRMLQASDMWNTLKKIKKNKKKSKSTIFPRAKFILFFVLFNPICEFRAPYYLPSLCIKAIHLARVLANSHKL